MFATIRGFCVLGKYFFRLLVKLITRCVSKIENLDQSTQELMEETANFNPYLNFEEVEQQPSKQKSGTAIKNKLKAGIMNIKNKA